jgi:hypothetical protein
MGMGDEELPLNKRMSEVKGLLNDKLNTLLLDLPRHCLPLTHYQS